MKSTFREPNLKSRLVNWRQLAVSGFLYLCYAILSSQTRAKQSLLYFIGSDDLIHW